MTSSLLRPRRRPTDFGRNRHRKRGRGYRDGGFNCRYLIEAIRACDPGEPSLSLNSPLMSMVVRAVQPGEKQKVFVSSYFLQDLIIKCTSTPSSTGISQHRERDRNFIRRHKHIYAAKTVPEKPGAGGHAIFCPGPIVPHKARFGACALWMHGCLRFDEIFRQQAYKRGIVYN